MRAGADPKLVPNTEWEVIARTMTVPSKSILLLPIVNNLIDFIWPDEERAPESASASAYIVGETYSGKRCSRFFKTFFR